MICDFLLARLARLDKELIMSDAQRVYQTVLMLICKFLPNLRREHRETLAQLVSGMIRSGNVQLRQIAQKLSYKGKKESLAYKFRRFLRNPSICVEVHFLPFVELILQALADQMIILMMDSTKIGGNCICLMLSIYYQGRALPLCWVVFKGKKGHSTAKMQLQLLNYIQRLLPEGAKVVFLGDGEFDSVDVVKFLKEQVKTSCRAGGIRKPPQGGQREVRL